MKQTILTVGNQDYTLKLRARDIIAIETKFKDSLVNVIMRMMKSENEISLMPVGDMVVILHQSLQALNHGMSQEKTLDLVDAIFESEDGGMMFLFEKLMELFQNCGLFGKEADKPATDEPVGN